MRQIKRYASMTDLKLVACVLSGQKEAYSTLIKRHHTRIYQMAYNLVGTEDDADDLAQMVFLKAFRSLHRFEGKAQFTTWIYRICVNCCYDWMKANQRWVNGVDEAWWQQLSGDDVLFGHEELTDQVVMNREVEEALDDALLKLTHEFRTVVVLREINGMSYDEIAQVMGCEAGTVKSRLFRARAQLRKILEPLRVEWQAA